MRKSELLDRIKDIAIAASEVILTYYLTAPIEVITKNDDSPLTKADLSAHQLIYQKLKDLTPEIPIISEESTKLANVSQATSAFWLVDPLDGTKEFIAQNGEFTVNIALIEQGSPTLGVVALPAKRELYLGLIEQTRKKAFKQTFSGDAELISTLPFCKGSGLTIVGSRSHQNSQALDDFLKGQSVKQYLPFGSSLKFCELAKGNAELYPRLGRTMEWDIAAGHAVLKGAGGEIFKLDGSPMTYGKENLENPHFAAVCRPELFLALH